MDIPSIASSSPMMHIRGCGLYLIFLFTNYRVNEQLYIIYEDLIIMFDTSIRRHIDPLLSRLAGYLVRRDITADMVSLFGFGLGILSFFSIFFHFYLLGLFLLLLSRLCDGLDGAVARQTKQTDFGGFLDIVLDFAFYGMIPLAFILSDVENNGIAGSILLLSFYINGAGFLTYALMVEKRGIDESDYGDKSIFYSVGLTEATETIGIFILFCLFPQWFSLLAIIFALLVFYTTIMRFRSAKETFGTDLP